MIRSSVQTGIFTSIEHICIDMSSSSTVPQAYKDAPVTTKGMFPGLWWNTDRYVQRQNRISELKEKIPNADVVGIVDTDSDGMACEVVLRAKYENPVIIHANGSEFGIGLTQALDIVSETVTEDTPVIVADLSPDSTYSAFKSSLNKIEAPVSVYDHHDWKWTAKTSIELSVDSLVIDTNKCAAQVLQEEIYPNADAQMKEFLEVTADHDLWKKEDYRSDHLSTLSFRLQSDEYVEAALEYGADMVVDSKELQGVYGESERKAKQRANLAVENAEWFTLDGTTVAITYFDCHQSRVGEQLIESGADLAVIIQPTLSVSFRSTEEFGRCAELARELNGGGHPDAAGANLYQKITVPETLTKEDLHIQELGDEEIDIDSITKNEYVWRMKGEPCIEYLTDFLAEKI